jgi:hypothetical protein
MYIIKIDTQMNPIRDANGFCIECKPEEKGIKVIEVCNFIRRLYCRTSF